MAKVKCGECGFISARDWKTREFAEIDDQKRNSGKVGSDMGGFEPVPLCFINQFNIKEEVEVLRKAAHDEPTNTALGYISPKWPDYVQVILSTERKCKLFRKYQQGFTPKEHKEMLDREQERKWRLFEIALIVLGNIIAGCLGAYLVWLVSIQSIKPPV